MFLNLNKNLFFFYLFIYLSCYAIIFHSSSFFFKYRDLKIK